MTAYAGHCVFGGGLQSVQARGDIAVGLRVETLAERLTALLIAQRRRQRGIERAS